MSPKQTIRARTIGVRQVLSQASPAEWQDGLTWYSRALETAHAMADEFGITVEAAAGILAALSPGVGWAKNVTDAYTVASGNDNVPVSTYGPNRRKAEAIRDGADPLATLGGNKVRAFYGNILSGGTDSNVTIDRHAIAALAYKLPESGSISDALYAAASRSYGIVAAEHGITGAQLQAVVWLTWRRLKGVSAHHG